MKHILLLLLVVIGLVFISLPVQADPQLIDLTKVPKAPKLFITITGNNVKIYWYPVDLATGYTLFFAPYPEASKIENMDLKNQTVISFDVPSDGMSWYVAVRAYNNEGSSPLSNIKHFALPGPGVLYDIPSGWMLSNSSNKIHHDFTILGKLYRIAFFSNSSNKLNIPVAGQVKSDGSLSYISDPLEREAVLMYGKMHYDSNPLLSLKDSVYNGSDLWRNTLKPAMIEAADKSDPAQADKAIVLFAGGKALLKVGLSMIVPTSAPGAVSTLTTIGHILSAGSDLNSFLSAVMATPDSNELLQALRAHYLVDRYGFYKFVTSYGLGDIGGYVTRGVSDSMSIGADGIKVLGWIADTSDTNTNAIGGAIDSILSGNKLPNVQFNTVRHITQSAVKGFGTSVVFYAIGQVTDLGAEAKKLLISSQYHYNVCALLAGSIADDIDSLSTISYAKDLIDKLNIILLKIDIFQKVRYEMTYCLHARLSKIKSNFFQQFTVKDEDLIKLSDEMKEASDISNSVESAVTDLIDSISQGLALPKATASSPSGTCGAYVAPGVWQEFDCYNLAAIGKTTNDDPFTPSWRLIGGYWQWGRKGPDASQWYDTNTANFAHGPTGPGDSEANSVSISGWDSSNAPNGSWSDSTKTANDPCPAGFRVPTKSQWDGVRKNNTQSTVGTWSENPTNYSSARFFGDDLMLPAAGRRYYHSGTLHYRGHYGYYWSSSEGSGLYAWYLYFASGNADTYSYGRRYGHSVRCVAE
jgi:uncharacterized protein (TIGR02145 family)